jgi:hypothetical protein
MACARRKPIAVAATWNAPLVVLCFCVAIAIACGTGPSAGPSAIPLDIRPPIDALKLNETVTWTAAQEGHDVVATWSTSNPSVLDVAASTGLSSAVGEGAAIIVARLGTSQATRSVQVVLDTGGEWSGRVREVACERSSGAGPSTCRVSINSERDFKMALAQAGSGIRGSATLEFFGISGSGEIQGTIDASRRVVLGGTLFIPEEPGVPITITGWNTAFDPSGGSISGSFELVRNFTNAFGPQAYRHKLEILHLRRQ